jgi:type III secretion protein V
MSSTVSAVRISTQRRSPLQWLVAHNDVALALIVVAVVALMIFPIPAAGLDLLIALNIGVSILLLMLSMYIPSALGLSTFPALLLFTTLFRLSLNIASTKQILLHAHAGDIIETFGKLIVGGSVIVGLVVFLIIAIVQFVVIAKGSERVAEVGARFTLDAMPGKQMSIDADLRSNIITPDEAKRRRSMLEMESKLHGAMDGAMKFVKGDAIVGILISAVNILAGILIGVTVKQMAFADALGRYAILSIGDAMVSQIPSLFVSIAAGILITRVADDDAPKSHLGGEIFRQITAHPNAVLISAAVLAGFAVVPGFPTVIFATLAGLTGGVGIHLWRQHRRASGYDKTPMPSAKRDGAAPVPSFVAQPQDSPVALPLLVRLGADLHGRVDPQALDTELAQLRRDLRLRTGVPFPGLMFTFDRELSGDSYVIAVHELATARGTLDGGPDAAPMVGQIAQAVRDVLFRRTGAFVGMQEVQTMLVAAQQVLPDLVSEVQKALPLQRIADVMRRLAEEGISIRQLRHILEGLIAYGPREKDPVALTEIIRGTLGPFIVAERLNDGVLEVMLLDPSGEEMLRQMQLQRAGGGPLPMTAEAMRALQDSLAQLIPEGSARAPAAVVTADVRRALRDLLEDLRPGLSVLSFQEIPASTKVRSIGNLSLGA